MILPPPPTRDRYPGSNSGGDLISHSRLTRRESTSTSLYMSYPSRARREGINVQRAGSLTHFPALRASKAAWSPLFSSLFHFLQSSLASLLPPAFFRDSSPGRTFAPASGILSRFLLSSLFLGSRFSSPFPRHDSSDKFHKRARTFSRRRRDSTRLSRRGTCARQIIHGIARVILIALRIFLNFRLSKDAKDNCPTDWEKTAGHRQINRPSTPRGDPHEFSNARSNFRTRDASYSRLGLAFSSWLAR